MLHNNDIPSNFVTNHVAKDEDLDFTESPFYWQNCNPSALAKTWHGFLSIVGEENVSQICDSPDDKNEFESEIIKSNSSIGAFKKFIEDGQKFGTINITNGDCSNFEMLKKMYGFVIYVVFEDRRFNKKDPRMKHGRHISFFTEYDLCLMNSQCYHSDESYYNAILDIDMRVASTSQFKSQLRKKETQFDLTRKKMYRNGFKIASKNGTSMSAYAKSNCPTKEEYFSNHARERLDSQDMMNLLWTAICDAHRDDGNVLKEKRNLTENLAYYLYHFNIIGFGWMPCLFAKQEFNELDKCIIHMYEKSNLQNYISKIENSTEPIEKYEDKPGIHKVLAFRDINASNGTSYYPLDKIAKIDREIGLYTITDINGKNIQVDFVDLVADIPKITIIENPSFPGCTIIGRYANGQCVKCEIDEDELWKEHSYEILDRCIPGLLEAIKKLQYKTLMNETMTAHIPVYSDKLKWMGESPDSVIDSIENNEPWYICHVPQSTYNSIGTNNDFKG